MAAEAAAVAGEEEKNEELEKNENNGKGTNKAGEGNSTLLSPGFRSAAATAGWDEEALLATLVVEDTPVRESIIKKRSTNYRLRSPPTSHSDRKRRNRRTLPTLIPPVVLCLDDDDAAPRGDSRGKCETKLTLAANEEKKQKEKASPEQESTKGPLLCMDRLRDELCCAICLEICIEPSTTPCGHSFCLKCLKYAAAKCGRRCPKCRQLIGNSRSCTVNTVLWNTIQLLFPDDVEARKTMASGATEILERSSSITNSNPSIISIVNSTRTYSLNSGSRYIRSIRSTNLASQARDLERSLRRRAPSSQTEDAALAYRLQREEFMEAFQDNRELQQHMLNAARANLRAMTSRAVSIRTRGRP